MDCGKSSRKLKMTYISMMTFCKHVNSYNWIGQNRKHLHKKAKTGSGGVGLFVKKSYYEMFDIGVLDTSFEGILWVSFKHKNSDFRFNICVAYLPPEKLNQAG